MSDSPHWDPKIKVAIAFNHLTAAVKPRFERQALLNEKYFARLSTKSTSTCEIRALTNPYITLKLALQIMKN